MAQYKLVCSSQLGSFIWLYKILTPIFMFFKFLRRIKRWKTNFNVIIPSSVIYLPSVKTDPIGDAPESELNLEVSLSVMFHLCVGFDISLIQ